MWLLTGKTLYFFTVLLSGSGSIESLWRNFLLFYRDLKYVDHIYIRAAKGKGPVLPAGKVAAIAEDVDVGKGHVTGHGT